MAAACSSDADDPEPPTLANEPPCCQLAEPLTAAVTSASPSAPALGEGTQIVGADIAPGVYRATGGGTSCRWERLRGFGGGLDEVIANGAGGGPHVVEIAASDAGFSSSGCGDWELVR